VHSLKINQMRILGRKERLLYIILHVQPTEICIRSTRVVLKPNIISTTIAGVVYIVLRQSPIHSTVA
jgi:hypothetical protein